ncbi:MAG: SGNH/GDSL hydrolase family protein [Verrucomicrobiota bacterium]
MKNPAWLLPLALVIPLSAREIAPLPAALSAYSLDPAPVSAEPVIRQGDRLAICGDSITEQKLYSVLLESYLTACMPDLGVTCRQYGWGGEQAGGFLGRMKSDVLRFQPTVATTCYGMNDFRYVPFQDDIAATYTKNQTAVVDAFQAADCRVVIGSPGIIDTVPGWVKSATGTKQDLNLSLAKFRNLNIAIAQAEKVSFADVFRPMLVANHAAQETYGPDFKLAGKDGVHPAWAGHVVMAYAFLKGLGLDGDLGSVTYDEASGQATAANGHEVVAAEKGKITLRSSRLPFAPGPGPVDKDDSIRAGMALVPFDAELNRFTFTLKAPKAARYTLTWGDQMRTYDAAELAAGINLAKDFETNPLVPVFKRVQEAVTKKQEYETRQIKQLAHGPEGAADIDATFALTEKARAPLEKAVTAAMTPTEHTLVLSAAP